LSERRSDPLTGFTPEPLGGRSDLLGEPLPLRLPTRNEPMMPRVLRPSEPPKAPYRQRRPRFLARPNAPQRPRRLRRPRFSRRPNKISPRWHSASKPRYAGRPATPANRASVRRSGARTAADPPRPATAPGAIVAPPVATPSPKSGFENLEDEMASLLGRPKNNS